MTNETTTLTLVSDARRALPERSEYFGSQVYIASDGIALKVGSTHDIARRIRELRRAKAVDLALIAYGSGDLNLEREIQAWCFWRSRRHGDWFNYSGELHMQLREHFRKLAWGYWK